MESGRQTKTQNACLENRVQIRASISCSPLLKVIIEYLVCKKKMCMRTCITIPEQITKMMPMIVIDS